MKPQAIQIKAVEIAMAIVFREENRIFALETAHTTYQMKVDDYGFLLHLYYGGKVSGDMDYLLTYSDRGFSGNPYDAGLDRTYSMDVLPQEYPGLGIGDFRSSAVAVRNGDGSECCDLRYVSHEIRQGKYGLKGLPAVHAQEQEAQTLEILLEDPVSKVQVRLLYGVLEREDIITRSAVIRNGGSCEITVEKAASACLDFVTVEYDLLGFYGRHAMERNLQRTRVNHGIFRMGSRRGTSSHQYNPAVILAQPGTTEDAGGCWGMIFVYSGNFLCEAERDQFDQTRVLMGLSDELFHYPLNPGESLIVPETILGHTEEGLGTLSRMFHRCIRNHICRGKYAHETRPVLLNSWEASYFDFSGETICALAGDAAALGMDMVVMDDGFQHRYVEPKVNIVMVDATRSVQNDRMLPRGTLRDLPEMLHRAHYFVVTKCPEKMAPIDRRILRKVLVSVAYQRIYFTRYESFMPRAVFEGEAAPAPAHRQPVIALSGIGNPRPFLAELRERYDVVAEMTLDDHHVYRVRDMRQLEALLTRHPGAAIVTTEKDAVKLGGRDRVPRAVRERLYYIPINISFIEDSATDLLQKLEQDVTTGN